MMILRSQKDTLMRHIIFSIILSFISVFYSSFCNADPSSKEIKVKANQGDAQSQYMLGMRYFAGFDGFETDYAKALYWFRKAADQGVVGAQRSIGYMYNTGQGVPRNYTESMKWYEKAAGHGDANAHFMIGSMYQKGEGVPQNFVRAYCHYSLAVALDEGQTSKEYLANLEEKMTASQIAEAQKLAQVVWRTLPKR